MKDLSYLFVVIASRVFVAILVASLAIFAVFVTRLGGWLGRTYSTVQEGARIRGLDLYGEEEKK